MRNFIWVSFLLTSLVACSSHTVEERPVVVQPQPTVVQPPSTNTVVIPPAGSTVICPNGVQVPVGAAC